MDRTETITVGDSLRERVGHSLRASIIAGDMVPGVVYSAPALATRYGVSATPVREAMIDLAQAGFVEAVRNKGFRVVELSERDLDEVAAVREMLEVPALAEVIRNVTPAALQRLRPLALATEAAAAAQDLVQFIESDTQFHRELLTLADNQRLVEIVGDLRMLSRMCGLHELAVDGSLFITAHEHSALLDLVEKGDTRGATTLMRQHIRHVRGAWAGRPEPDADDRVSSNVSRRES